MSPEEFTKAGEALYGRKWRVSLALVLDRDPVTLWRYATGRQPVPKQTADLVARLLREKGLKPPHKK